VWILQTLPTVAFGLFTRWFHRWALLIGWLGGMAFGTIAAYRVSSPTTSHWAAPEDLLFGHHYYIGISAIIINIVLSAVFSLIFNAFKVPAGADETLQQQYTADPEEKTSPVPAGVGAVEGATGGPAPAG
jgi:solute:Na+ symporter, SSS family